MRRRLCRKCVKPHKCNGSSFKNSIKENLNKSRQIPKCKKMLTCFLIINSHKRSHFFYRVKTIMTIQRSSQLLLK